MDAEECALFTGCEDILDLGIDCGCTESLLSSPFEKGVTGCKQEKQAKRACDQGRGEVQKMRRLWMNVRYGFETDANGQDVKVMYMVGAPEHR